MDNIGEMGKLLGSSWKALNETDKQEYMEKAQKDKERYEKEMEAFNKKKDTQEDEEEEEEEEEE